MKRWRIGGYRWWIDQWQAYCTSIAMRADQNIRSSLRQGAVALPTKKCFVRIICYCPQVKKGRWIIHTALVSKLSRCQLEIAPRRFMGRYHPSGHRPNKNKSGGPPHNVKTVASAMTTTKKRRLNLSKSVSSSGSSSLMLVPSDTMLTGAKREVNHPG